MKKCFLWAAALCMMCACEQKQGITVTVTNSTDMERNEEIVEVPMDIVCGRLHLPDTAEAIVLDGDGAQVPYQITSEGKLIFPATVGAHSSTDYTIRMGMPITVETSACGRHYPERVDDIAWENDKVAFRTYGPALQATGERAFGYDVWVKNVPEMVVEERYANELNPETAAKIAELKKTDPKAAAELYKSVSYHVDHGNGLDCYKVGPTLGGGTTALLASDSTIIYPYCYREYEILDNGPLRFRMRLVYAPMVVEGDSGIIETRFVSLDKGSHLNKTVVTYRNLRRPTSIAAGIVIHPENPEAYRLEAEKGYIAYQDLTDDVNNGNGEIYVGAVFPAAVKEAKVALFSEKESKEERGGALGHVLAINDYESGAEYVYYWGSGWSKAGMDSMDKWTEYLAEYAEKVRHPLTVTLK